MSQAPEPSGGSSSPADRLKFQELQAARHPPPPPSPPHYQHYIDGEGNCIEAAATAAADSNAANSTNDAVGEELVQWLESCGADSKKLLLQQYAPEVRGVHSKKVLVPGERILAIPKRCLITVEMGKRTEIGQKLLARNLDFVAPKHIFLMMFLLTDMEDVRVCLYGMCGV